MFVFKAIYFCERCCGYSDLSVLIRNKRSYTTVQFFQDLPFRLSLQFFSSLSELYAPVTQGHARLAFKYSFR